MVTAEITRPPSATRNPAGRVLEVLGRLEDPGVDLKVVMAKYALPDAFPAEVEAEAARVPQEVRRRGPRRPHRLPALADVTVDPETARDHDDAISLDRLPQRPLAAGACTSRTSRTTSARARSSTRRPTCAGRRCTSRTAWCPCCRTRSPANICSLVEGEDRLTQTVVMELDAQGTRRAMPSSTTA